MKIGLRTPIVSWSPSRNEPWEQAAGPDDVTAIAQAAERLGFDLLTCPEHIAVPPDLAAWSGGTRGTVFWDPIATLAFLAARTTRIRLATMTIVIGYYHPLEIAKRFGTVDMLSAGRLIMGIGVGSAEEEFDLLEAPFADRGPRADDALRALRASFASSQPEYSGAYYSFSGFVIEPGAVQAKVPLWIGGHSIRSLERAVNLADGWAPQAGMELDTIASWLGRYQTADDFELVLSVEPGLDPSGAPDAAREQLARRQQAGATTAIVAFRAESLSHYLEQLEAFREVHP